VSAVPGHRMRVGRVAWGGRRGWFGVCECGWHGKGRPTKGEAAADAGDHRIEVRYGPLRTDRKAYRQRGKYA